MNFHISDLDMVMKGEKNTCPFWKSNSGYPDSSHWLAERHVVFRKRGCCCSVCSRVNENELVMYLTDFSAMATWRSVVESSVHCKEC